MRPDRQKREEPGSPAGLSVLVSTGSATSDAHDSTADPALCHDVETAEPVTRWTPWALAAESALVEILTATARKGARR